MFEDLDKLKKDVTSIDKELKQAQAYDKTASELKEKKDKLKALAEKHKKPTRFDLIKSDVKKVGGFIGQAFGGVQKAMQETAQANAKAKGAKPGQRVNIYGEPI